MNILELGDAGASGGNQRLVFRSANATDSYSTVLKISGTDGEILVNNFAASWGNVKLKFTPKDSGTNVIEETVDVSSVYADQLKDFANKILNAQFDNSLSAEAAENVKFVQELYHFE